MIQIRMENLSKHFGDVAAVDGVTATVAAGELFFLLGPSGCGKTTLLRLIAGFLETETGAIHFDDRRMDTVPAHLRNTGMVFQNYALWPHMNVHRNVKYGLDIRRVPAGEKARRVADMLSLVRMAGFEERLPAELSGGQQQRVALARALVVEPDVVLLDEPLSNLDAKLRLEMRAEIRRIHSRSPRTAIYVTHDQKEALSMADRIALINDGRIVQVGTPEEVYTRPTNLFCARFIGNANVLGGTVSRVEGAQVSVETEVGTLAGRSGPAGCKLGDAVVIAIRPEALHAAKRDEPNAFAVEVTSRMYLGEMVQYQARAGSTDLTATVLGAGDWHGTGGEKARLAFKPDDAIVFPAET